MLFGQRVLLWVCVLCFGAGLVGPLAMAATAVESVVPRTTDGALIRQGQCSADDCRAMWNQPPDAGQTVRAVTDVRVLSIPSTEQNAGSLSLSWHPPERPGRSGRFFDTERYEIMIIEDSAYRVFAVSEQELFGAVPSNRGQQYEIRDGQPVPVESAGTRQRPRRVRQSFHLAEPVGAVTIRVRAVYSGSGQPDQKKALTHTNDGGDSDVLGSDGVIQYEPTSQTLGEIEFLDSALAHCLVDQAEFGQMTPVADIKEAYCASKGIGSLWGIEHLYALEVLVLLDNPISSIASIADLGMLQRVNIGRTNVRNISYLSGLSQLRDLRIQDSAVNSLASLVNLFNLERLNAERTDIWTIPDLSATSLRWLSLSGAPIRDLSGLQDVLALEWVNLNPDAPTFDSDESGEVPGDPIPGDPIYKASGSKSFDIVELQSSTYKSLVDGGNINLDFGDIMPLITNASAEFSNLHTVDLRGNEDLFCPQLDTLETLLPGDSQTAGLGRPAVCNNIGIPTALGSTDNPSVGNAYSLVWQSNAVSGMHFEVEEQRVFGSSGTDGDLAYLVTTDHSYNFDDGSHKHAGTYLYRVRICYEDGVSDGCGGWSTSIEQVVMGDPGVPGDIALEEVSDTNLAACLAEHLIYDDENGRPQFKLSGELNSLSCSNRKIQGLFGISGFPNLSGLYLSGNQITLLYPLEPLLAGHAQADEVVDLNLHGNQVNAAQLQYLVNFPVRWSLLELSSNGLDSIDALQNLQPLANLNLSNNNLTDISALSGVNVETLNVINNQIQALPAITGLASVYAGGNLLNDVEGLTHSADSLIRLFLDSNPLASNELTVSTQLAGLTRVQLLTLANSGLTTASFITHMPDLWLLHLTGNQIEAIDLPGPHANLRTLLVGQTPLQDLSFVTHLPALEYLFAASTNISDLGPLAGSSISNLTIGHGDLSEPSALSPLADMLQLNVASFSHNGITDISALLDLASNPESALFDPDPNSKLALFAENEISCRDLRTLHDRGLLRLPNQGQAVEVPECVPDQPGEFQTLVQENLQNYEFLWDAVPPPPAYHGTARYEIHYQRTDGSGGGQAVVDDATVSSFGLTLDNPASDVFWQFKIRSCRDDGLCSDWSENHFAQYPPVQPQDLSIEYVGDNVALSWGYVVPPGQPVIEFEISALFPVVEPVYVPWGSGGPWSQTLSSFDEWPGGIVRIRACYVETEEQFCGPSREIRIVEPVEDNNIPAPSSVSLEHLGGVSYSLSWDHDDHEDVDYYRIEESPEDSAGRVYAVESLEALRKYQSNYRKRSFSVRACQRVRGAEDRCSNSAALLDAVTGNTVNPFNSSSLYGRNLCWFDGGDLTSGGAANYRLRWTYDSGANKAPDQFGTRRTTLNAPILKTQEFRNAKPILFDVNSADPDNPLWVRKWGWELEQSGSAGERIKVVPLSHGLSNNQWVRWQPPYSSFGGITPIITQANGEFAWDESSRCPEPIEPESTGRSAMGGPGALNPGTWITTKPDIETDSCGDEPNPELAPAEWQIWKNCRYTPSVGLGTGWRFYWTNELRIDEVNEAFGASYDLVAFWHTYKMIRGVWSPVWYYSRMQATGSSDGQYVEGALMYPQAASSDLSVGTVRVYFGSPEDAESGGEARQHAWLNIDMDHDSLVAHEEAIPLRDFVLDGDVFEQNGYLGPRKNHHYRGVWTPQGGGGLFPNEYVGQILEQNDFFVVEWAVGGLSSIGLHGFDDAGEPFWLINFTCHGHQDEFGPCEDDQSPDLGALHELGPADFVAIHPSINPFYLPEDFHAATAAYGLTETHKPEVSGSGLTRLYRGTNPDPQMDFLTGSMCIDLSGTLEYENSSFTRTYDFSMGGENCSTYEPIKKIANLHYINFDLSGDADCDLVASEHCQIRLTWFTDDYYPDALPMYSLGDDVSNLRELGELCAEPFGGPFDFLEHDQDCHISTPGQYRFHLVNWPGTSEEAVIASSRSLATGAPSSGPLVPLLPVTQPPSIPGNELSASSMIGSTAGEFRVTEGGAASYSIPIATVPGSGGVAPQISLEYNSHQGYGPLGLSWGLAGLSTISRCGQTLVHDGHNTGIQLDTTDRFCLDGQRLIKVSGDGGYGAPGSVYRLEIDNLTRVQAFGERGGSPTHFVVQRSDGSTSIFGSENDTTEDQIIAPTQNIVFAWPMTRFEDSASNFITFEYYQPDPANFIEWLPRNIRYTGNSRAAKPTFARLYFDVGLMPVRERSVGFSAGERVRTVHRINRIISFAASNTIHRMYRLGYTQASGGQSALDSVQECWSAETNACLPATTFSWATGQLTTPDPEQTQLFNIDNFISAQAGDLTGDGRQEILHLTNIETNGVDEVWMSVLRNVDPTLSELQLTFTINPAIK